MLAININVALGNKITEIEQNMRSGDYEKFEVISYFSKITIPDKEQGDKQIPSGKRRLRSGFHRKYDDEQHLNTYLMLCSGFSKSAIKLIYDPKRLEDLVQNDQELHQLLASLYGLEWLEIVKKGKLPHEIVQSLKEVETSKNFDKALEILKGLGEEASSELCVEPPSMYTPEKKRWLMNALVTFIESDNSYYNVIDIQRFDIDDATAAFLSQAIKINSHITKLHFRGCAITDNGMQYISEALKVNSTINDIGFVGCRISDEGVAYLAEALKVSLFINFVDLSGCGISEKGKKLIADALEKNTTVVKVLF